MSDLRIRFFFSFSLCVENLYKTLTFILFPELRYTFIENGKYCLILENLKNILKGQQPFRNQTIINHFQTIIIIPYYPPTQTLIKPSIVTPDFLAIVKL